MAKAWIYQDDKQVKKHGPDAASWYVGWIDPEGKRKCKSCGPGEQGHRNAEKLRKKREAELIEGTYQAKSAVTWDEFVEQYTERVLDGLEPQTKRCTLDALAHFKRHVGPARVFALGTEHIDRFISKRRSDPGQKEGSPVSPATINKDLRHLKAALNVAAGWGYLQKVPRFRMEKVPKKLVRFVTAEHFALIYRHAEAARMPRGLPYPAADWWRGLFVFGYMTGWRISEILALRRQDVDLEGGYAVTLYEDNKGDRDDRVKLHQVVIDHLEKLAAFDPSVFPWPHDRRTLDTELDRIQEAAGIHLPCRRKHEHTDACHLYGFHDLRRAFATMNAPRLTADALQALMRHKSYLTTQVYINMASQIDDAVNVLHVPEVLKPGQPEKPRRKPG
jgi:integrase